MWQRVQTLYLAIATALVAVLLFSVKAVIPAADGEASEIFKYTAYIPYLILIVIAGLLDFLALTTYKFRVFQMRTAVLAMIITIALQIWLAVDYFATSGTVVFKFTAVFPIIAAIFDLLAVKGIAADIMVVESVSRLRSKKKR